MDKVNCILCGDDFTIGDDFDYDKDGNEAYLNEVGDGYVFSYDEKGGIVCEGCIESIEQHSNTIVYFDGEEKHSAKYESGIVLTPNGEEEWLDLPFIEEIITKTRTVRMDAWRSYDTPPMKLESGWKPLLDGWHGTMDRSKITDRYMYAEDVSLPFIVVFGRTSNVCSIGFTFYIRDEDEDEWKNYFGGINPDPINGQGVDYVC